MDTRDTRDADDEDLALPGGALRPGDALPPYVVEAQLGAGGAATVYRARHQLLGTEHALKVLHDVDPHLNRRTVLEGRIQAGLQHPNVVRVTDILDHRGRVVLVLDLVDGPDLHAWIRAHPCDPQQAEALFRQIVAGVGAAHARGIVHRDLKPANVLVAAGPTAKVTDFGLGRIDGGEGLTRTGMRLGTPAYMAPEQLQAGPVDRRADLWALGCILHELLVGGRAFPQQHVGDLVRAVTTGARAPLPDAIPAHLAHAVQACLAVDPDRRPQTCEALAALLDGLDGEAVANLPSPPALANAFGATWHEAAHSHPLDADAPSRIGEFSIVGRLGSGGMGVVWEAEQRHPRRRVALKTLHPGQVSPRARERFRFEAEALGQLVHPAIPRVYAAGEDRGLLYLVMEKVDGMPLGAWFEANRPDTEATIAVFLHICDAVHHAHLRGFVHRDLKPDNILMTPAGEPRVLDFGIAQAIGVEGAAAVVGTPAYMAPEQLRGEPVDVRADVYALGVVLYQLWAGRLPVDPAAGLAALLDPPPVRPLGELDPACKGDLEAIVGKALRRDREQRYATVEALAEDLRRHLAHAPVTARAPTRAYLAGRWLRRNRLVATAVGAVVLALSVGLGLAWTSYLEAERAHADEQRQRLAVEAAKERAEHERENAEAITDFLSQLLLQAHPDQAQGRELTIREALDGAEALLDEQRLITDPTVEATVRLRLGSVYEGIGDRAAELELAEKALALVAEGPASFAKADAQMSVAYITSEDDPVRGSALAEASLRTLAQLEHLTEVEKAEVTYRYPRVLRNAGDREGAARAYRALLEVDGLDAEQLGTVRNQLAYVLSELGAYAEAVALYQESLAFERQAYGERHPQTASVHARLGKVLCLQGDRRGLEHLREALDQRQEFLAPDHRRLDQSIYELANGHLLFGEPEAASEALSLHAPEEHARMVAYGLYPAELALVRGDLAEAQRLSRAFAPETVAISPRHRSVIARIGLAGGEPGSRQALEEARAQIWARLGGDNYFLVAADRTLAAAAP